MPRHLRKFTDQRRTAFGTAALLCAFIALTRAQTPSPDAAGPSLHWQKLPAIPDPEGFASAFAGVSGGALIVAGGANVIGDKWQDPLHKKWYDLAFVLEQPNGQWKTSNRLPQPRGYGVSVTAEDSVICIGGSDATRHFSTVFRLRWKNGYLENTPLPDLPQPCANACGALVGTTIYVAGGLAAPAETAALHTFWALDLAAPSAQWQQLAPWPGTPRMLAVAGTAAGSFFLFTGTGLHADVAGKPVRDPLRDAYRFTPGQGWTRLADLPRPAIAAPSPAIPVGPDGLILVGGDDGANNNFQPVEHHPGFPRTALVYDVRANTWSTLTGVTPLAWATAPTTFWHGRQIIVNGEVRPRVRTPEVWSLQVE